MHRTIRDVARPILFACLSVFALAIGGCDGPCRVLAERICECEPNASLERACIQQIGAVREDNVSVEEEELCDGYLDTCDCEALAREDFAACGLTKPVM